MPTKYADRLVLPLIGSKDILFTTSNGLKIACGYERVAFLMITESSVYLKPLIEFSPKHMISENIVILPSQKWRIDNPKSEFVEFRSKDFTNIRIMKWKTNNEGFKKGMFYISPFDLSSKEFPVLIERLNKRKSSK